MAKKTPTKEPGRPGIIRANINREMVASDAYVTLYVNDTQIQISPWDFRFLLGVIVSTPDDRSSVRIQQVGEVRMSPQHAKTVARVLLQQIQNYEEHVGQIPQPQG